MSLLLTPKVVPSRAFITLETETQLQSIGNKQVAFQKKKLERKTQENTKKGLSLNVVWGVCYRFMFSELGPQGGGI